MNTNSCTCKFIGETVWTPRDCPEHGHTVKDVEWSKQDPCQLNCGDKSCNHPKTRSIKQDPPSDVSQQVKDLVGISGHMRRIGEASKAPYKGNQNAMLVDELVALIEQEKRQAKIEAISDIYTKVSRFKFDERLPVKELHYQTLKAIERRLREETDK